MLARRVSPEEILRLLGGYGPDAVDPEMRFRDFEVRSVNSGALRGGMG